LPALRIPAPSAEAIEVPELIVSADGMRRDTVFHMCSRLENVSAMPASGVDRLSGLVRVALPDSRGGEIHSRLSITSIKTMLVAGRPVMTIHGEDISGMSAALFCPWIFVEWKLNESGSRGRAQALAPPIAFPTDKSGEVVKLAGFIAVRLACETPLRAPA